MSAKSTKATKKMSVPRTMEEIQKEYQQLMGNLGQLEYQIYVYGKEKERIQTRSESVNNEAAARMQLDKEAKAAQPAETAV